MTYQKIVVVSILLVATSLLALNPSMIGNAQGQMYDNQYRHDNSYYQEDNRYGYDNHQKKSSQGDIQKIKCVNSNINLNGIDITEIPQDNTALGAANEGGQEAANTQNGNGLADRINFERNLVNICANVNVNDQLKFEEPFPPIEIETCEGCFVAAVVTSENQDNAENLLEALDEGIFITVVNVREVNSLFELCLILDQLRTTAQVNSVIDQVIQQAGLVFTAQEEAALKDCVAAALGFQTATPRLD